MPPAHEPCIATHGASVLVCHARSPTNHPAALTLPLLVPCSSCARHQVKFLNRALETYDASIVVPTHYVLFTLSSIIGCAWLRTPPSSECSAWPFAHS